MKPISWHVIKTASSFGFQNCCDVNSHDLIMPPMKVSCIRNKDVISFNLVRGIFPTLSYIKNCITGTCDDKCKWFYARLLKKNCFPTKHCHVNTFQSGRNSLEWLNFWLQQSSYWNVNTTFLSSSTNWGWKWKLNWSTLLKNYHKRTTNVAPVRSIETTKLFCLSYFLWNKS